MPMNSNKNILIVDDQINFLESIVEIFEHHNLNYEILRTTNPETAIEIAKDQLPDIIITDWEMPMLSGIEMIKKLKTNNNTANIPIIMCTGAMTGTDNLKIALEAGAIDYINKPIDETELIARTQSILKISEYQKKMLEQKKIIDNDNKQLKELNATKDKFFSIIAHDLRGPLGSLYSLGEILWTSHDEFDRESRMQILETLATNAKSTFNLLDNLLKWASSNTGAIKFNPKQVNINDIIEENFRIFRTIAESKNLTLKNSLNKNLQAYIDYDMINTVIRNLISNALKYTPNNGTIEILSKKEPNNYVEIGVSDSGVGIEKNIISQLFELDSMHTTLGTNKEKGSGLGLKLCKEFIEKNNGNIWAESEIGKGTQFWLSLPIAEPKQTSEEETILNN